MCSSIFLFLSVYHFIFSLFLSHFSFLSHFFFPPFIFIFPFFLLFFVHSFHSLSSSLLFHSLIFPVVLLLSFFIPFRFSIILIRLFFYSFAFFLLLFYSFLSSSFSLPLLFYFPYLKSALIRRKSSWLYIKMIFQLKIERIL